MSSDKSRSATAVGFCEESDEAAMRRVNDDLGQMANAAQTLGARERLALACRLLTDEGHGRSLAGQVTVRAEEPGTFWTNSFGSGLAGAQASSLVCINEEMRVVEGSGTPNPGVRFHLCIYDKRPELQSIVHTHPPFASALSMAGEALVVAHMDATMFYDDCAYLADWPGVPIANEEGRIICEALGAKRSILLAHHGMLTTGRSLDEALYLAIHLERACELHLRARSLGPIKPIAHDLAVNAHSFMTMPGMIASTVDYWLRQAKARHGDALN